VSLATITLCAASQRVSIVIFRHRFSPETFGYTVCVCVFFWLAVLH
jgi:hypothetical protein